VFPFPAENLKLKFQHFGRWTWDFELFTIPPTNTNARNRTPHPAHVKQTPSDIFRTVQASAFRIARNGHSRVIFDGQAPSIMNASKRTNSSANDFLSGLVFGFDVGTGSIGYAVRRGSEFLDVGVLICDSEGSDLSKRRDLRRQRRTLRSRKVRRAWFANELAKLGLTKPERAPNDPISLRLRAVNGKALKPEELHAALAHLFKRRGYSKVPWAHVEKTAKDTSTKKDDEEGTIKKAVEEIRQEMEKKKCLFPCQLLDVRRKEVGVSPVKEWARKIYWPRDLLEKELRAIIAAQKKDFPQLAEKADWLLYGDSQPKKKGDETFHVFFKAKDTYVAREAFTSLTPKNLGSIWPKEFAAYCEAAWQRYAEESADIAGELKKTKGCLPDNFTRKLCFSHFQQWRADSAPAFYWPKEIKIPIRNIRLISVKDDTAVVPFSLGTHAYVKRTGFKEVQIFLAEDGKSFVPVFIPYWKGDKMACETPIKQNKKPVTVIRRGMVVEIKKPFSTGQPPGKYRVLVTGQSQLRLLPPYVANKEDAILSFGLGKKGLQPYWPDFVRALGYELPHPAPVKPQPPGAAQA
jgi:hypothetical protein